MAKDYIDDGGLKVPSKAESLEHAQIAGVHGKKVFVVDSAGNQIDAATESTLEAIKDKVTEDVAQTLTYNADGTIATMVKVVGGVTYTKTFSYTDGNVTGISAWVAS